MPRKKKASSEQAQDRDTAKRVNKQRSKVVDTATDKQLRQPFRLPPSSEDLEVPREYVRDIVSIYETLHSIGSQLHLAPFSFDELCTALAFKERCRLLRDVHVCLLSAVIEGDFQRGQQFGTNDEQDSVRLQVSARLADECVFVWLARPCDVLQCNVRFSPKHSE